MLKTEANKFIRGGPNCLKEMRNNLDTIREADIPSIHDQLAVSLPLLTSVCSTVMLPRQVDKRVRTFGKQPLIAIEEISV